MKNPKIFTVFKNGAKMEYDVILTFKSEVTGKDYVVYTDNSYDEKINGYRLVNCLIK